MNMTAEHHQEPVFKH